MNRLKSRWLWWLAASLALAGPALAGEHGGDRMERLKSLLELDDYQAGEVERVLKEQREQMKAAWKERRASGERPDPATMQAEHEARRAELRQQLAGVLTPEQLAKLEGYLAATHEAHRMHRHRHRHREDVPDQPADETT